MDLFPAPLSMRIPNCWRTFKMSRQGEEDYTCAWHCIVSGAAWLNGCSVEKMDSRLRRRLAACDFEEIDRRMQDGRGLQPGRVRSLADAAGLLMRRPRNQDLKQFDAGGLSIAMVRYMFPSGGTAPAVPFNHYVLVLEHLRDKRALVIADPHPSRRDVYCLGEAAFVQAWDKCAQHRRKPKWSARLSVKDA